MRRGARRRRALGDELGLPVFLYGALARRADARASCARGGAAGLAARMRDGGWRPTSGRRGRTRAPGATLVAARPPLVAFNLELAPPATLDDARRIAAAVREGGAEGLPGRARDRPRARGARRRAQVSLQRRGPRRGRRSPRCSTRSRATRRVAEAELVGLAPRAAFDGWPERRRRSATAATLEDGSLALLS